METPVRPGETPFLLAETGDFAVVYKPPRLHSVPLRPGEGGTLLDWYGAIFPPALGLGGKKPHEGGALHRLDYETHGLVLFGKNHAALDSLRAQQEEGRFIKEYGALTVEETPPPLPGFPPPPEPPPSFPGRVASYFRPYGPGRKAVRPAAEYTAGRETAGDRGRPYETEIVEITELGEGRRRFTLRIARGFRHQIRCHLAWLGNPIAGDPLYGKRASPEEVLALRAQALRFFDPRDGSPREFRLPAFSS
jgi:23S rRNA pseudouridine1911/1915/1917 synthase